MQTGRVLAVAAFVLSCRTALLLGASARKPRVQSPRRHNFVWSVAFSANGLGLSWTFSDRDGSAVCLWQKDSVRTLTPGVNNPPLDTTISGPLALSPDDRTLAVGEEGFFHCYIWLLNVANGSARRTPDFSCGSLASVVFSPRGHVLVSASMGLVGMLFVTPRESFRLWDPETGRRLGTLRKHCIAGTSPIAFSPDGNLMAVACSRRVYVLDARSHGELWAGAGRDFESVTFSGDGRYLAASEWRGRIDVWDPRSGEEYPALQDGVPASTVYLASQPNGPILASGGADHVIRLWNTDTGKEIQEWGAPGKWIGELAFSPNGKRLASVSSPGALVLWDVASGREVWRWSANPRSPGGSPETPHCEATKPPWPW